MSTIQVKSDDPFESSKVRTIHKIEEYLSETFARDRQDVLEDVADILDVEVSSLPKLSLEVKLTFGKAVVAVDGFEAEEKEEPEEDKE